MGLLQVYNGGSATNPPYTLRYIKHYRTWYVRDHLYWLVSQTKSETNNTDYISLADEERIKREYRARKRAEETTEQRNERNRKQREYCAMKKARAISKTLD